jgi:hypothetical protein
VRFETADFYRPLIGRADAGQAVMRQAIASRGNHRLAALCRFLNEHVTHAQVVEPPRRGIAPSPLRGASCIRAARPAAANLSDVCVRKRRFSFVAERKKRAKVRKIEVNSLPRKQLPRAQRFTLTLPSRQERGIEGALTQPLPSRERADEKTPFPRTKEGLVRRLCKLGNLYRLYPT